MLEVRHPALAPLRGVSAGALKTLVPPEIHPGPEANHLLHTTKPRVAIPKCPVFPLPVKGESSDVAGNTGTVAVCAMTRMGADADFGDAWRRGPQRWTDLPMPLLAVDGAGSSAIAFPPRTFMTIACSEAAES